MLLINALLHFALLNALLPKSQKMSNFLQIASRVEAAVASYVSVREFTDRQQWKQKFEEEFVSIYLRVFVYAVFNHSTFEIEKIHC